MTLFYEDCDGVLGLGGVRAHTRPRKETISHVRVQEKLLVCQRPIQLFVRAGVFFTSESMVQGKRMDGCELCEARVV
jgi:hypothetical protein